MKTPVTFMLIAINFAVFLYGMTAPSEFGVKFGLNTLFIDAKFYFQPLTTMFLHGGISHLLMNMAVLYGFGSMFERFFGSKRFALIYLVLGVATSLLSFVFVWFSTKYGSAVNVVGASGAICVLFGIYAGLDKKNAMGMLIAVLAMSFLPILVGLNIAWYAHIIGFGLGYLYIKIRQKNGFLF